MTIEITDKLVALSRIQALAKTLAVAHTKVHLKDV